MKMTAIYFYLGLHSWNCLIFLQCFSLKYETRTWSCSILILFTVLQEKKLLLSSRFLKRWFYVSVIIKGSFQGWSNSCTILERLPLIRVPNRVPQNKIRCLVLYLNLAKFFFLKTCKESITFSLYLLDKMIFSCRITVELPP